MRVLIVSAEAQVHDLLRAVLQPAPEVSALNLANSVAGAEVMLQQRVPDVVVVAHDLPDGTSFDLLRRMKAHDHRVQMVVVLDCSSGDITRELVRAGASDVLLRTDLDPQRVVRVLVQCVERHARMHHERRDVTQLELAVQMFEQFAQTVAHDVRRPLGTIQMLAEVLASPRADSLRTEDVAARIGAQAAQLLDFIDALLEDARRMADDRRESVSLEEVVDGVFDLMDDRLPRDRVEVVTGDVVLWAREGQLRQALLNLLTNAARHGGDDVQVRIALERQGEDAVITVDDDGPGVPEQDLLRVTVPGVRLSDDVGGHGLGLAAVDLVMNGHGGAMELSASPMGGLRVLLRFPGRDNVQVIDMPEASDASVTR